MVCWLHRLISEAVDRAVRRAAAYRRFDILGVIERQNQTTARREWQRARVIRSVEGGKEPRIFMQVRCKKTLPIWLGYMLLLLFTAGCATSSLLSGSDTTSPGRSPGRRSRRTPWAHGGKSRACRRPAPSRAVQAHAASATLRSPSIAALAAAVAQGARARVEDGRRAVQGKTPVESSRAGSRPMGRGMTCRRR